MLTYTMLIWLIYYTGHLTLLWPLSIKESYETYLKKTGITVLLLILVIALLMIINPQFKESHDTPYINHNKLGSFWLQL